VTRTLLIDADIIAYQCSASNEENIDWGDGVTSHTADFEAACEAARQTVDHLVATLKADGAIICLSDDFRSFRKEDVYPLYKSNRKETVRPEHLYDLKEWLGQEYKTVIRARLEADDVMGILSTEPHEGERIIVSADKDMQTIPGLLFNPNKPELKIRSITPAEAERFMLWQAITGDQTDGYPGCPGSGPKAADRLLAGTGWEQYTHTFASGPRKGTEELRWREKEGMGRWPAIVSAYEKAGLTEQDAVVQVNCARILKHSDMDGNRIIRWSPEALSGEGD
jgi:DNA polymerase-1